LGRTLSEACKVFALGRIWLGAAKCLMFRHSARHKLQILTNAYSIIMYFFIIQLLSVHIPFTYNFISLSSHLMLHTVLSFCLLIFAALFSIVPLHSNTPLKKLQFSNTNSSTLLLEQQTFLLLNLHTLYTHFTYVTGEQLMNHEGQEKRTYTARKWQSLSLICW
jgi:hypothetical protein